MSELLKELANPKGKFGIWGIVVLVTLGIAMMVLPGLYLGQEKAPSPSLANPSPAYMNNNPTQLGGLEQEIAADLCQILNQVEGAGEVAVSVALAAGPEQNYAENSTKIRSDIEEKDTSGGTRSTSETNEKTELVFSQNGGSALVIQEIGPEIKGVLVVAEGAEEPLIRAQLSEAIQTILNLPAHRVMILPKKGR